MTLPGRRGRTHPNLLHLSQPLSAKEVLSTLQSRRSVKSRLGLGRGTMSLVL